MNIYIYKYQLFIIIFIIFIINMYITSQWDIISDPFISFENNFNDNVNYLPNCVVFVRFGVNFNKSIDYFPYSVKNILLEDSDFTHKIDK